MDAPKNNQVKPLDRPEFTDAELRAARTFITLQRRQFALHIEYATDLTYTTVSTVRADASADGDTDA